MEDTFSVESGGRFVAVFDGHGGNIVSTMLRDNLYRIYRSKLVEIHAVDGSGRNSQGSRIPTASSHAQAIREALQTIEGEVMTREDLVYQVRVAFGSFILLYTRKISHNSGKYRCHSDHARGQR